MTKEKRTKTATRVAVNTLGRRRRTAARDKRLLAAAPDLLAALTRIADYQDCNCRHDDENCCVAVGEFCPYCIASVAIMKAGGR